MKSDNELFVDKVGELANLDMQKTGVLASVTVAQAILESGYGRSELAIEANNYFGMKASLSGNTWASAWDNQSIYSKKTIEHDKEGNAFFVGANFRKYPNLQTSINDHSLYLIGARKGAELRYKGLAGEKDYRKAIQIIKDGGYATDVNYVEKVCDLIERWDLTKFDKIEESNELKINQNPNFKTHNTTKRTEQIEYIVIHYVGATGDAEANIKHSNKPTSQSASADFFVGHNGDIWQYNPNPRERYCWSVGGSRQSAYGGQFYKTVTNKNSISVEMCVKTKGSKYANSHDWYFTNETLVSTVELVKHLMKEYNIPSSRVIRHYDVNGKLCPGVFGWNKPSGNEDAWYKFKSQLGADWTTPFKVRVKIGDLNIREGAGYKRYKAVGYCPVGLFTIVEVKENDGYTWGKLKSGRGWIALEYCERL